MTSDAEFRWTQDLWEPGGDVPTPDVASRDNRLAWLGIIALGFLTFELTSNPVLSTSLACLKFGWAEFRMARWLRLTDPDRARGRICSRFYLAWGLWRISLTGTALFFIVVVATTWIEEWLGIAAARNAPPPSAMAGFMLAIFGFTTSSLFSTWAVDSALRRRVRIWVGPEARWAREDGVWPPQSARRRRATVNRARAILYSAVITAATIGLTIAIFILVAWFERGGLSPLMFAIITLLLGFFVLPAVILTLMHKLGRLVIAASPSECWKSAEAGTA